MTVGELIKKLETMPQDAPVYLGVQGYTTDNNCDDSIFCVNVCGDTCVYIHDICNYYFNK